MKLGNERRASPSPTPFFIDLSAFLRRATVVPLRISSMWRETSRNLSFNMSVMRQLCSWSRSYIRFRTYCGNALHYIFLQRAAHHIWDCILPEFLAQQSEDSIFRSPYKYKGGCSTEPPLHLTPHMLPSNHEYTGIWRPLRGLA